nr:photosystem II biogenesis protein Psp29 [Geitlerinema sp. PCC 9228]
MDNLRTVSDTKRAFYSHHTRPINSIYRQFVEELMVEMHLLSVNANFQYDPIYGYGVVSTYEQFMQGYKPPQDKDSIFDALCQSINSDPQQYRQDAQRLEALAAELTPEKTFELLTQPQQAAIDGLENSDTAREVQQQLQAIANHPNFKYSRLFAIGLYGMLAQSNAGWLQEDDSWKSGFGKIADALNLPQEKIVKDIDLYRSNLDKMQQARDLMQEILESNRKQQQRRVQQKEKAQTKESQEDNNESEDRAGESPSDSSSESNAENRS